MEDYQLKIEQLRNGEIDKISITKEQFLEFREILLKQQDFKHFRGEAQQGGHVIYTYTQKPRS